ncbi:MAG: gamma-glutamylcyclotransferase [Verrucomicrobia bacterium]|nr:gamma-glutamylcyclotransferase [Verrucomicrobiota bacterium]
MEKVGKSDINQGCNFTKFSYHTIGTMGIVFPAIAFVRRKIQPKTAVALTMGAIFILAVPLSGATKAPEVPCYYFGYGSNLSYDFLKERLKNGEWIGEWEKDGVLEGPVPTDLGVYALSNYEFGYTLKPFDESYTTGNILPKEGAKVYGALYLICSQQHIDALDASEDVPRDYKRVAVKVHQVASSRFQNSPPSAIAYVYVGNKKYVTDAINPDPEYVDFLIEAAQGRALPTAYIDKFLKTDSVCLPVN